MYLYELKIIDNGITFFDDIWADNSRDAVESGELNYPNAFVELA